MLIKWSSWKYDGAKRKNSRERTVKKIKNIELRLTKIKKK